MNTVIELKESKFDIVFDSQRVFKILMSSFAFPGRINKLPEIHLSGIDQKYNPAIIPLLALLDLETSFNIVGDDIEEIERIIKYFEINTGAKYKDTKDTDYCLSINKSMGDVFKLLNKGILEEPDKSTTLFYFIESISKTETNSFSIILSGPGIKDQETLSINGLSKAEIEEWLEDRANYPLGIDIFLIDKIGNITGLPRSIKISMKG